MIVAIFVLLALPLILPALPEISDNPLGNL